jgi:hypothetical protein
MDKEEKLNKKRSLSISLSETEEIIGRLKEALNVKSDGELANNYQGKILVLPENGTTFLRAGYTKWRK